MPNPFGDKLLKSKLYCLGTGRAASEQMASQLHHSIEPGNKYAEAFKAECLENPDHLEKTQTRT